FALQAPQGPAIQEEVPRGGQRPHQHTAYIGFAIDHRRHRYAPSFEKHARVVALYYHKTCPVVRGYLSRVSGVCAVLPRVGAPRCLRAPVEPLPGQPCGVRGTDVTVRKHDRDALLPGLMEVRRDSEPRSWFSC